MSKEIDDTQNAHRIKLERFLADKNIAFNGNNPWDIKVYNPNLYERMLTEGSIGFGEAYMDGWWDCDQLDEMFHHLCTGMSVYKIKFYPQAIKNRFWAYFTNRQNKRLAAKSIKQHYDLGNELYRSMLGKHLAYSCGYWQHAGSLDQSQEHKFCYYLMTCINTVRQVDFPRNSKYRLLLFLLNSSKISLKKGVPSCQNC
jgi:cyclopropane-fatty-acyl-phospholipid synthase